MTTFKKSAAEQPSRAERIFLAFAFAAWVALAVLLFSSCATTVVPKPVPSEQASFDENELTSGVISSVPSGFVVTAHFRQRYNALIATYGGDFAPPLKPDQGIAPISDSRWLISKQAMVWMLVMNDWRRAGLQPKHP